MNKFYFWQEACWDGYKQVGMKKKGNKQVPNCVPEDAPANAVAHGGVDMNPTGRPKTKKMDKRMKYHPEKVYRRSKGGPIETLLMKRRNG